MEINFQNINLLSKLQDFAIQSNLKDIKIKIDSDSTDESQKIQKFLNENLTKQPINIQQNEQQKEYQCSFQKNDSDQIYIAYYGYQSQLLKQAEQNDIDCVFQKDQIILKSQKINVEKIKKFFGKFLDQINIVQLKFDSLNQKKAFFDCKKIKEKMKLDQIEKVQVQNRLYLMKFQEQDLKKQVVKIQDFGEEYLKFIQNNYYKKFYFLTESFISPKQIQDKRGNDLNNVKCQLVRFFIDNEKDQIKKILKAYPEVMVETLYYRYTKSHKQQFQFRNCYIFTKENIYDKQLLKDNINRKKVQFDTINQIDQLSKQILNDLLEKYFIVGIKMIRDQGQKQSTDEIKAKTQQINELLRKKQFGQTIYQQFDYKKGFLILVFNLEFFKEKCQETQYTLIDSVVQQFKIYLQEVNRLKIYYYIHKEIQQKHLQNKAKEFYNTQDTMILEDIQKNYNDLTSVLLKMIQNPKQSLRENKEIENNNLYELQISNIDGQNQCHTLNITFEKNQDENDIGQTVELEQKEEEEEQLKIQFKQQILQNQQKIQKNVEKSMNQDIIQKQSQSDNDADQSINESLNLSKTFLEDEESVLDQSYILENE